MKLKTIKNNFTGGEKYSEHARYFKTKTFTKKLGL